jgi:hypothetical protein
VVAQASLVWRHGGVSGQAVPVPEGQPRILRQDHLIPLLEQPLCAPDLLPHAVPHPLPAPAPPAPATGSAQSNRPDQVGLLAGLQRTDLMPQPNRPSALDGGHSQHLPGGKDGRVAGLDLAKQRGQLYPCLSKKTVHFGCRTRYWRSRGRCRLGRDDTSYGIGRQSADRAAYGRLRIWICSHRVNASRPISPDATCRITLSCSPTGASIS